MPPQNRLAPTPVNSLANYIPAPSVPGAPQADPRLTLRQRAENLSAGLGYGLTTQVQGMYDLVTQPVESAKELWRTAQAIGADPMVVLEALREARRQAMSGPLGAGEVVGGILNPRGWGRQLRQGGVKSDVIGYQGSRHKYAPTPNNPLGELDSSKIGTGEGGQTFGHGLYIGENRKTGEAYKTAGGNLFVDTQTGELIEYDKIPRENGRVSMRYRRHQGHLYTLDVPDEMVDRMLDWDLPLSEQPESIRTALMPLVMRELEKNGTPKNWLQFQANKIRGADIVKGLFRGSGAEISETLRAVGIPGVKYLDAGSRMDVDNPTRNFVVFPGEEKRVKILKRE